MRSFIGWIGGKSHLKNQIISLIPSDSNRYIEVCGGAGWVLFGKDKIKGQCVTALTLNIWTGYAKSLVVMLLTSLNISQIRLKRPAQISF